ncbi:MAG: hypothetical protein HKN84_15540 [Gammaproteobacteria bacterium]|nr:hypothetical protein [Gammaproteobacteria bacterium]
MTALHPTPVTPLQGNSAGTVLGSSPAAAALAIIALPLLGFPQTVSSQTEPAHTPLFADETPLALTIEGPFRTLSRERRERNELEGLVRYKDSDGTEVTLDVQIRTRGNSRMDICTYPPLRLNFRRRQVEGTVFAGQDRIKLVTLCKDTDSYRDYLAFEYEIYRIYNALSDISYRVRWADIEYVRTDGRRRTSEHRPGFLIEEDTEAAARTGLETWDVERVDLRTLEPRTMALLGLFHFFIGNTDWAGTSGRPGDRCCHNGDVLRTPTGQAVLIPYDFDQAGLINTEYAKPAASLPIRSVRQRLYRGYCRFNNGLDAAVERFNSTRAEIESIVAEAQVSANMRRRAQRYVEAFYELIDDPDERLEQIDLACRGQTP